MVTKPFIERECNGGIQKIFRFENGYGASVVQHYFSYGHEQGLFELAVISFTSDSENSSWDLDYSTPITDDVIGHLSVSDYEDVLEQIKQLPKP